MPHRTRSWRQTRNGWKARSQGNLYRPATLSREPLCKNLSTAWSCIRSSCSPHYSGRSYSCRKQKNTYITINQQCNYQIKNYSVYWLSIEGLNKFLYFIFYLLSIYKGKHLFPLCSFNVNDFFSLSNVKAIITVHIIFFWIRNNNHNCSIITF